MLLSVGERDGNGVEDGVVLELPRMLNYTKRKGGTNRGEGRVQRWMMQSTSKLPSIFWFSPTNWPRDVFEFFLDQNATKQDKGARKTNRTHDIFVIIIDIIIIIII
jgi:hypothetical protein